MRINLQIDRLVLDGIETTPGQRQLLKVSVVNELTRLLKSNGLSENLANSKALLRLNANNLQLNNNEPKQLGLQIAQSVYGGLIK